MLAIDPWLIVERASFVAGILILLVTVLGVGAGLYQLRLLLDEQRSTREELARSARIRMGLIKPNAQPHPDRFETSRHVTAFWELGDVTSEPVKVGIGIANDGTRTAVDLVHELVLQGDVGPIYSTDGRIHIDPSGQQHVTWGPENLNPRSGLTHYVFLHVPKDIAEVTIAARAGYRDAGPVNTDLGLVILQRTR